MGILDRRREWRLALLAIVLGGGALALGLHLWTGRRATAPDPPAVDLSGVDPEVAQVIQAGSRAVRASPQSASAWGRLGMILSSYPFTAQAAVCFAEAERLDPKEPRWPYLHGLALVRDDPEAALGHLRRAVELGRTPIAAPRLRLAETLLQLDDLDEAEHVFLQLLQENLAQATVHLDLGRLALKRGQLAESLAQLEQAARDPQSQKAAHTLLAEVHQRLGQDAAAGRELASAASLPDDPPWPDPFVNDFPDVPGGKENSLLNLDHLRRQEHLSEATQLFQQMKRNYPDLNGLFEGQRLMQEGNYPAAESALRRAVELNPRLTDAHLALGEVLFRQQKYQEAGDSFRKVAELDPGFGPAYYHQGQCWEKQGNRPEAIKAFRREVGLMPQNAAAQRDLGDLLAQDGLYDEAFIHLRYAVQIDPADQEAKKRLENVEQLAGVAPKP